MTAACCWWSVCCFVRRRPEIFWAMIVGAVIGGLYARGMKVWFDELRPPAVLPPAEIHLIGSALSRHSFPRATR